MESPVLDSRKKAILNTIIRNYQETGEPVGSRTISKLSGMQISSATIRNEMSDLRDMGLIQQPHTSAGCIPTDKGYRLYVDEMMQGEMQLPSVAKSSDSELLIKRVDRVEELLVQMAKVLAQSTKYASMVTGPSFSSNKVKFIQLSPMDDTKVLGVIVLGGNVVRNNIFDLGSRLEDGEMLKLNLLLNKNLNGLSLEEINLAVISRIKEEAGPEHADIITKVLDAIAEAVESEAAPKVYTSGAPNIFMYPELSGGDKASELISALEEKEGLRPVIADRGEHHEIQVLIGDEIPIDSMKDCSVVTASYELEGGIQGKFGIIGPKRMDYEKVVSTLKDAMTKLSEISKEDK